VNSANFVCQAFYEDPFPGYAGFSDGVTHSQPPLGLSVPGIVRLTQRTSAKRCGKRCAAVRINGAADEVLRCSYAILSGRVDGGTVLAAGEHALRLALHLPDPLAGDP
jgi:hypothetical protein